MSKLIKKNLIGQYPSCDMLNNAIRFIFEGKPHQAISEIVFAIEKAGGCLCDDIKDKAKEIRQSTFTTESEDK